ncbi:MAG: hypothetical protein FJ290_31780 [Planctomycetes bacterium]|nr:hypothetical protein [Planctomycetota bacterium]
MTKLTPKRLRRLIASASEGYREQTRRAGLPLKFSNPRLYDDFTDFDNVRDESGVYIIYCTEQRRTPQTRDSRILYIGRGWIGAELLHNKNTKRALDRFAAGHTVKYTFCSLHDVDLEFVVEGVLLNEHRDLFGCLPSFNKKGGSSTLLGWHDVISLQPGPRRILHKYGA